MRTNQASAARFASRLPLALALAAGMAAGATAVAAAAPAQQAHAATAVKTVKLKRANGVTVTPKSTTSVTVSWNKVAKANKYRVRCGTKASITKAKTIVAKVVRGKQAEKCTVTFKGLKPGKTYYFQVRADKEMSCYTAHAKWSKVAKGDTAYTITYNTNNGTIAGVAPASYTAAAAVNLPQATRMGCTFAGWYNNAQFTGEPVSKIEAGSKGNLQLYAKWDIDFNQATVDTTAKTYDGTQQKPTVSIAGLAQDADYKITYGKNTVAGKGSITIDGQGAVFGSKTYNFNIVQREVTLKWGNEALTYNGKSQAPSCVAGNLADGDSVKVTVDGAQVNAGEDYTAKASKLSNPNYKLPEQVEQTFSIAKAVVTVSGIKANDRPYNGTTVAVLDYSAAVIAGKIDGDDLTVSATGTFDSMDVKDGKAVTISDIKLEGTTAPNYELAAEGQQDSATANITKREITIAWDTSTSILYNGKQQIPACAVKNAIDGDALGLDVSVAGGTNAGTYMATAKISNTNYSISSGSYCYYTIKPMGIISSNVWIKSGPYPYTGKQIKPEVKILSDIEASGVLTEGTDYTVTYGENINAGKEGALVTINGKGNYTGTWTFKYEITKINPTYTAPQSLEATDDKTLADVNLPYNPTGTWSWDEAESTSVGDPGENTFHVTFTPYDTNNYNTVSNIPVVIKVTKHKTAFAVYCEADGSLDFYNQQDVPNVGEKYNGKIISNLYTGFDKTVYADWYLVPWYNDHSNDIESVNFVDEIAPISTAYWFSYCTHLTTVNLDNLNPYYTTSMARMFEYCTALEKLDVSKHFTTSALNKVDDMTEMFSNCTALKEIKGISTMWAQFATKLDRMFFNCESLTADCSGWSYYNVVAATHENFSTGAKAITEPEWAKSSATVD